MPLFHFLLKVSVFNKSYYRIFKPKYLTLGGIFAIEAYEGAIPKMERQVRVGSMSRRVRFFNFMVSQCSIL